MSLISKIKLWMYRQTTSDGAFKLLAEQEIGRQSLARKRRAAFWKRVGILPVTPPITLADRRYSIPYHTVTFVPTDPDVKLPPQIQAAVDKANSYYTRMAQ